MIKTTSRKSLTGRIYNLQWYKLESLPLHPWRGEFTLIVDGVTRRPEKLSCTIFGENASRLRLIDPPPPGSQSAGSPVESCKNSAPC